MNHRDVGRYWNSNAEAWTKLVRAGYDVYRDHLNTPWFLRSLPEIAGRSGLDIGCGEGHNTRLLASAGAGMTAIDIADVFVGHAQAEERSERNGIRYVLASAVALPFADASFDFATAFMSLMDIPETETVLREAYRVIRPGGFLQFSISHPCFMTPYLRKVRDESGVTRAFEVAEYFRRTDGEIEEWLFGAAPPEATVGMVNFRIPRFHRPLGEWISLLLAVGFVIVHMEEPVPDDATVAANPKLRDAQLIPYFLHIRVMKPRS